MTVLNFTGIRKNYGKVLAIKLPGILPGNLREICYSVCLSLAVGFKLA